MRSEVRRVLDVVEEVLFREDQDARDLASILSALRGPDGRRVEGIKDVTTAAIRTIAFPRLSKKVMMRREDDELDFGLFQGGWIMRPASWLRRVTVDEIASVGRHFGTHIDYAIKAIERVDDAQS